MQPFLLHSIRHTLKGQCSLRFLFVDTMPERLLVAKLLGNATVWMVYNRNVGPETWTYTAKLWPSLLVLITQMFPSNNMLPEARVVYTVTVGEAQTGVH